MGFDLSGHIVPYLAAVWKAKTPMLFTLIPLPRMTLPVSLFEVGDGELCVVLDGVEGLVAEEFLDVVHAGTDAEHSARRRAGHSVADADMDTRTDPSLDGRAAS